MNAKRVVPPVLLVAAVVVAAWFVLSRDGSATDAMTASGTVEATEADVGFQAGGRIATLLVAEGDAVTAGQELARLDAAELDARRAAALAQQDGAQALLAELEQGARPQESRQAQAAEAVARERMEEAARALERTRALEAGGAVSREALDHAQSAYDVARSVHVQAREQLDLVQRGPRTERVAAQRAVVRQAAAAVAQADAALANSVLKAPFDGVVTVRHRQLGETVSPGAPVVTVMNPAERWVRIYVREDIVGRVSVGQAATIRSDSHGEREVRGRVTNIASRAEFTPRNVQTAEERVKLVYAVRVAILDDAAQLLKPGVPADVTLIER
jgi:HlyD family secretion protein